jgi:Flp pilus assembly protein TadG
VSALTGPAGPSGWSGLTGWIESRRARLDDRGSGAAAVIIFAFVFLALAAFVVDGGLSISQRERAADIAEQAARYAAQDIDREALYGNEGGAAPIKYQDCDARVHAFAVEMGMSTADIAGSHCTAANAQRVVVTVQLTYEPILTGMFYSGSITVHGSSVAESVTG